jgi:BRCT domain type II-containing protein
LTSIPIDPNDFFSKECVQQSAKSLSKISQTKVSPLKPVDSELFLSGQRFATTGTLSMGKEAFSEIVKRYGGKVSEPSKNTNFAVLGKNPGIHKLIAGRAKLQKIQELSIKTLTEIEFNQIIESKKSPISQPNTAKSSPQKNADNSDIVFSDIEIEEISFKLIDDIAARALPKEDKSLPENRSPIKADDELNVKAESAREILHANPSPAKRKVDVTNDSDSIKENEKISKKSGYASFLAKKAAPAIVTESRPPPIGAPNCLSGMTFVFTGDLKSLSREDSSDIVKRYGGKVTSAPSGKTSFVVVGQDPGFKVFL